MGVRVQVQATRFRVPDVSVVLGPRPEGRIIRTPPLLAIEVLSPDDRASDLQEKIDDYLAFGAVAVWVLDPRTRRAWSHTGDGAFEARDGVLRSEAFRIEVPLSALLE